MRILDAVAPAHAAMESSPAAVSRATFKIPPMVFGCRPRYDSGDSILCDHNNALGNCAQWTNRSSDLDFSLTSSISSLIRELRLAAEARQSALEGRIQTLLTEALGLIGEAFPDRGEPGAGNLSRPAQLVAEFLRLAEAHCRDRWRLTDYARALHVSAGHLRATCVKMAGAPPIRLIHEYLIREAKHRLIGSSLPITAIALDLGFEDAAYFSRLFHSKCGMSPQQYRLSFRQNASAQPATMNAK